MRMRMREREKEREEVRKRERDQESKKARLVGTKTDHRPIDGTHNWRIKTYIINSATWAVVKVARKNNWGIRGGKFVPDGVSATQSCKFR